jgi:hypothetical protein
MGDAVMVENCKSCAFWMKDFEPHSGQCRRRSPGGPYPWYNHGGTAMVDIWPHTGEEDFCGDWELKDAD